MLFWILQSMFLSIIFILVVHHLIHFFKTTLTIPKMKDLVNAPTQKYDNMYNIIGNSQSSSLPSLTSSSDSYFLPSSSSSSSPDSSSFLMKNELKQFLKTQLKR
jgi:hypothetical protein